MKLPLQPIYADKHGLSRFRGNRIVRYLLDHGGIDLNQLAVAIPFEEGREDWEQFAQLIEYSLSGFSELSYVSDETYEAAAAIADHPGKSEQEARLEYLEGQVQAMREALKTLVPQLFKIHPDDLEV
jgi:hypothetical protein